MKHLFQAAALTAAFLLAPFAWAEPPPLKIPADLKPVAGYIRFTPETTAKSVLYLALDDAYPFPSEELKDTRRFILPVMGLKDGTYRFFAIGSLNDEMSVTPFSVVIGKGTPADPPKDSPKDPPKEPIPPPVGSTYFIVIRPDGPATQEFARIMADAAWAEHRSAGIRVKDYTLAESASIYKLPSRTNLPCVLALSSGPKESKVLAGPVNLPTTSDGIRKLAEVLK